MSGRTEKDFEALALPYLDAVYDVALRLTGSPSDAMDLAQETYLRAFASFGRFELGSSIRAWLFTILRNAARNLRRDGARHPTEPLDEESPAAQAWPDDVPEWSRLTPGMLDALIARLPIHLREVIVLRELQGLSYREIASVLSCPVGTVMSRLHRGRGALRKLVLARIEETRSVL
jgi:RNA polymerase sigma-70 factor, ECF subfamily